MKETMYTEENQLNSRENDCRSFWNLINEFLKDIDQEANQIQIVLI